MVTHQPDSRALLAILRELMTCYQPYPGFVDVAVALLASHLCGRPLLIFGIDTSQDFIGSQVYAGRLLAAPCAAACHMLLPCGADVITL